VQGIDAAPAAAQTETGFDAGRVTPRVQADHQSAVTVDATASVNNSGCVRTRITSASPQLPDIAGLCWYFAFGGIACCCERAVSGQVTAPPSSVMNSRRGRLQLISLIGLSPPDRIDSRSLQELRKNRQPSATT
ncbi:MAG: hypothetical protein WAN75_33450, partial [Xanthobacteraceae bacterium]